MTPFLDSGHVALHYEVRGSGEPIVLLHGFTSSLADTWIRRGWVDLLAGNGFRVVGLDLRSHGKSERVYEASECTTARLGADVVDLLDRLDLDRAALFGFSMGGGVALALAMDHPRRVARVVVTGVGDAAINRLHDPRQIADLRAAFEADSEEEIRSPAARAIRRSAELGDNDLKALAPFLRNGGWPGGLDEQRAVTAPILLVAAGEDQYMAGVDELVRWLPHADVERVPSRDHYTVLDDETVRRRVVSFLRTR